MKYIYHIVHILSSKTSQKSCWIAFFFLSFSTRNWSLNLTLSMIINGGVVYKTGCMNSVVSLDVHVSCVIIQKKKALLLNFSSTYNKILMHASPTVHQLIAYLHGVIRFDRWNIYSFTSVNKTLNVRIIQCQLAVSLMSATSPTVVNIYITQSVEYPYSITSLRERNISWQTDMFFSVRGDKLYFGRKKHNLQHFFFNIFRKKVTDFILKIIDLFTL